MERGGEWQDRVMIWNTIYPSTVVFANTDWLYSSTLGGRLAFDIQVFFLEGPGGEEGCLWCSLLQQDAVKLEASGRSEERVWLMEGGREKKLLG